MRTAACPGLFGSDERGATGAEKALVVCFALAVIILGGALVSRGSRVAAGDAERALASGGAGVGALGQVVQPIGSAGEIAAPKGATSTVGVMLTSLITFSGDYQGDAPEAPPPDPKAAPAPAQPPRPTLEREVVASRSGGTVRSVSMTRLGLLPRSDPLLRALRDALGNQDIDPASVHGVIPLWRAEDGGTATVDPRGTIAIDRGGGRGVVIFRDGSFMARTPGANLSFDEEGRLRSYTVLGRSGTTVFAAGSYRFGYGADGRPNRVEVTGGPHAGTWTRGDDGRWTSERGARWGGADGSIDHPGTWATTLGQQVRLAGISNAALAAIDAEMTRVRAIWREYFPDADGLGLRTFRNVVGSGFSGNIAEMQRLSRETTAITTEIRELRALAGRIEGGSDPVEIARQSREFSRRAQALRDRIDRFRDDSARVVGQSMRAGRAWAIAKDVYGLGTASGPVKGLWNLGNLIKDVVGE